MNGTICGHTRASSLAASEVRAHAPQLVPAALPKGVCGMCWSRAEGAVAVAGGCWECRAG